MVEGRCSGEKSLVRPSLLFLLAALAAAVAGCGGAIHRTATVGVAHAPRHLQEKAKAAGPFAHPLGMPHENVKYFANQLPTAFRRIFSHGPPCRQWAAKP